ncbi:integral membrane transport protein [Streptomyces sp. NPDC000345]|uniref:integral membrane transport protein n=1 Tax=Streptomyces sp. NPDC000345 TaxID=3364537 RepID=UPI00367676DF
MTAVTDTLRQAAPGHPVSQSVRDSLVVAKRNLIRMPRIPNPVRPCRSGFTSGKEPVK